MAGISEFFRSIPDVIRRLFQHDSTTRSTSVELWVVIPAVVVLFQFTAGSMAPRFVIGRQINPGIHVLRTLSYYSVTYALGLMKPSAAKEDSYTSANDFFQVWAVLIVTMQESARIGRPYRPKEMTLVDLLSSLWAANQLRAHTSLFLKVPLWVIWSIHASRVIWYYFSSNRASVATNDNMKLVSDYMEDLLRRDTADSNAVAADPDPATMTGYEYLVLGEDKQEKKMEGPGFMLKKTRPDEFITLEKVWTWTRPDNHDGGDRLLGGDTDRDNRFKDVCLSFALYKLLRRRFYDFPIPEASDPAMRRLVSDAILLDEERAFRVTEVELSFLQDFSYSKHAVVFAGGFPTPRLLLSLSMTAAALYLVYAVRDIPSTSVARTKNGKVARITHGIGVTRFLIFIVVCRELWEVCVYVLSHWTKVLIICHYVRLKRSSRRQQGWMSMLQLRMVEMLARIMFSLIHRVRRWDGKIHQKNLLMPAHVRTLNRGSKFRFVKLQSVVKSKLFDSLKALIAASPKEAENNSVLKSYLVRAFAGSGADGSVVPPSIEDIHGTLHGETHKILAWHVATSLCQINLMDDEANLGVAGDGLYTLPTPPDDVVVPEYLAAVWPHYATAVTLSNYCLHLVTEALLPDSGLVARKVFDAVRCEAEGALRGCRRTRREIHDRLVAEKALNGLTDESIVKIGAQLSVELMRYESQVRWELLGKFWAGYLLYLSASTTSAKHRIHLQGPGELTTHLWALLSHAGFLGDTTHGHQLLDPVVLDDA